MNLNGETLEAIEEMAGLFFSAEDIAVNIGLDEEETELFCEGICSKNSSMPMVQAYLKGWLNSEIALRKAILSAAINGSNPSQQQLLKFLSESKR